MENTFGAVREATIIDKAIDKHYIVVTTVDIGAREVFSLEFANAEREQAKKIVAYLNNRED